MRKPLIQHEVHNNTRDRNIHPQRPGPARDRAMLVVPGPQSAAQRDDRPSAQSRSPESRAKSERPGRRCAKAIAQKPNVRRHAVKIQIAARNNADETTAAIMHARCAAILPRMIRMRPMNSSTALVPFKLAIRAGKKAYCSANQAAASCCGDSPSETPTQT